MPTIDERLNFNEYYRKLVKSSKRLRRGGSQIAKSREYLLDRKRISTLEAGGDIKRLRLRTPTNKLYTREKETIEFAREKEANAFEVHPRAADIFNRCTELLGQSE